MVLAERRLSYGKSRSHRLRKLGNSSGESLKQNGHEVTLWSRREEESRMLREERENKSKLPGVKIPDDILCTTDLEQTVGGKRYSCSCNGIPVHPQHGKKNGAVRGSGTAYCGCVQGN